MLPVVRHSQSLPHAGTRAEELVRQRAFAGRGGALRRFSCGSRRVCEQASQPLRHSAEDGGTAETKQTRDEACFCNARRRSAECRTAGAGHCVASRPAGLGRVLPPSLPGRASPGPGAALRFAGSEPASRGARPHPPTQPRAAWPPAPPRVPRQSRRHAHAPRPRPSIAFSTALPPTRWRAPCPEPATSFAGAGVGVRGAEATGGRWSVAGPPQQKSNPGAARPRLRAPFLKRCRHPVRPAVARVACQCRSSAVPSPPRSGSPRRWGCGGPLRR
jgi:hypothetical protein